MKFYILKNHCKNIHLRNCTVMERKKNHAKPFSKCIVKSIAFVSLQFKKEF